MATPAVLAQLPGVDVLVAAQAVGGQAKEAAIQVLHSDRVALGLEDVLLRVALLTNQFVVLALQRKTRLAVVEFLLRWFPSDQRRVLALVLGVAAHAILAGIVLVDLRGMKPARGGQTLCDLGMTFQAAERNRPRSQLVTTGTLSGPVQRLMRMGQCAGRKLGRCRAAQ